jgi:hypothetical protein
MDRADDTTDDRPPQTARTLGCHGSRCGPARQRWCPAPGRQPTATTGRLARSRRFGRSPARADRADRGPDTGGHESTTGPTQTGNSVRSAAQP